MASNEDLEFDFEMLLLDLQKGKTKGELYIHTHIVGASINVVHFVEHVKAASYDFFTKLLLINLQNVIE